MRTEEKINGKRIVLIGGTAKKQEILMNNIKNANLVGDEKTDRLIIQEILDDTKGISGVDILYEGNTVYPYKKTINKLKKMVSTGRLDLDKYMYHFLSMNFDIAHYDIQGFTYEYDNSWWNWILSQRREFDRIPPWRSDLRRIIDSLFKMRAMKTYA